MSRRGAVVAAVAVACALLMPARAHAQAGQLTLTPQQGTEFPDRTFVLTLPDGRPVDPASVSVTENGQPVDGVRVAPLQSLDQAGVVLVIDASDSMHGASIETRILSAEPLPVTRKRSGAPSATSEARSARSARSIARSALSVPWVAMPTRRV